MPRNHKLRKAIPAEQSRFANSRAKRRQLPFFQGYIVGTVDESLSVEHIKIDKIIYRLLRQAASLFEQNDGPLSRLSPPGTAADRTQVVLTRSICPQTGGSRCDLCGNLQKAQRLSCQDATSLAPGHTNIEPRLYRSLILLRPVPRRAPERLAREPQ
jgi:hypothetical protein